MMRTTEGRPNFIQWRQPKEPLEEDDDAVAPPEPKTTPLIELLCKFNGGCSPHSLHTAIRKKYTDNLAYLQNLTRIDGPNKTLITTTHLRGDKQLEVRPDKLTKMGADRIFALRGFLQVTVRQYYYVRHRVKLQYPHLPLVGEFGGGNGHVYYYPLECLALMDVKEEEDKKQ